MDFATLSAIQLLFLVEHGSFDSQECLGYGICNSDEIKNTNSLDCINYRGIENLWGNMFNIIDGFKVEQGKAKWSNSEFDFTEFDFEVPSGSGYIKMLGYDKNNNFGFVPVDCNGASNIGCHDYFDMEANGMFLLSGGNHNSQYHAGLWCMIGKEVIGPKANARLQFHK